jgi:hypothetical protein
VAAVAIGESFASSALADVVFSFARGEFEWGVGGAFVRTIAEGLTFG